MPEVAGIVWLVLASGCARLAIDHKNIRYSRNSYMIYNMMRINYLYIYLIDLIMCQKK